MLPDLRILINMKRKKVKFRVIKKVAVSFTVKVNLKERHLHTVTCNSYCVAILRM